jgi:DNA polymerase
MAEVILRESMAEILGQARATLAAQAEIGLETPPLSPSSLEYLGSGSVPPQSLDALRETIGDCQRCKLHLGRNNLVFGEGDPRARLVFVGEGPGRDEDLAGRPFVGEAGKLLEKIIKAMGLERGEVYICNVVKCRPPKNRDPEGDEVARCLPFLEQQIRIIRPEVICCLGRVACQSLLADDFKIKSGRGKWHSYLGIPVMPTFHPAYLLRYPSEKRQVWEDVKKIMKHLGLEVKGGD